MVKYYLLTKYPGIFKNTYWGNFTQPPNETIDAIIANRNAFVEKYNVKRRCPAPLYVYKKLGLNDRACHDHVECYDAGTSYVVVSSPYGTKSDVPAGFVLSDQLYSNDCRTFIATVEKKARRDQSPTRK
jgi:hypothetical protein